MLPLLIYAAGAFALVLGLLHFTFPESFGFRQIFSGDGPAPPPFRLWFYRYPFRRDELFGILKVMNHCTSYTIVSIGVFDLLYAKWHGTPAGLWLSAWAAGFWLLRAATQLYLGRRPGDWFIIAVFTALACVQLAAAII